MISHRVALTILLAVITSALLPSVTVADKVVLVDTAETNHNERQVKGDPMLCVLVSALMTHSEICSWSCSGDMNCIRAFCLLLVLAHLDLILLYILE